MLTVRVYCHFLQNRSDVAAKNSVDEIVNIIRLLWRMITIVLLTQRSRLSGPSKYLARFHKVYRKFSRSIWKKVSAQNRRFSQNIPSWLWAPFLAHNWAETFFQISPETFLWASCTHPRYLEGLLSSYLCVSKKIMTIRHTEQIICQEKRKNWDFEKMKLQISLEYSEKTSCFELKLFFKCF